ncbi:NFX1-type zinc finger-containing protein 1-like [Stegodyphus dumicola]|uniref:NFX1-type zinc finger-containing protein 1-like n=1 Tax=Stegodyphus dumicola TaxID=202533 RepID=UPI0015ADDFD1|nr:NFX1-type zinc finger-containing protein 1-like [Stegodyphus dumicola]
MDDEICSKVKAVALKSERNSAKRINTCGRYNKGNSPRYVNTPVKLNEKLVNDNREKRDVTQRRFARTDHSNSFMQVSNFQNRYSLNFLASTNMNGNKTGCSKKNTNKEWMNIDMNRNRSEFGVKHQAEGLPMSNVNRSNAVRTNTLKDMNTQLHGFQTRNKFPPKDVEKQLPSIKTDRMSVCQVKEDKKLTTLTSLKMLLEKDETEILFMLVMDRSGFKYTLSQDKFEREMMTTILNLLGKACRASQQKLLQSLIHDVMNNQHFLLQVQHYLLYFQKNSLHSYEIASFQSIIDLLKKFQETELSNSTDTVLILLPILQLTCDVIAKKGFKTADLKISLLEIENGKDLFLHQFKMGKKNESEVKSQQNQPPEDFRSLSILPTVGDLQETKVFLRPNIVQGKYADVEHYLDVQFRLLREDYVRPLRNGIQQYMYLSLSSQAARPNLKALQDVRIYYNFQLLYPCLDRSGLVYMASFDVTPFRNINWENSKRLLTGSLICFSDNNFETLHLASVTSRDAKLLKQGHLLIKFESVSSDILNFESLRYFIMVETQAYFEAYRHNLSALREMNEVNFPFQKYIVKTENVIKAPNYLKSGTMYDMTPFVDKLSRFKIMVPVLNYKLWPSEEEFGLDKSQYLALKSALAKELCIIQGPPGTGKTFIGLKIAEILLHNKRNLRGSPILVVCYTNHALDQFLEGILNYSESVGRVGGSCTNKELAKYQLNNLRMKARKLKSIPGHVRCNIAEKCQRLSVMTERIELKSKTFHACFNNVLDDVYLFHVMSRPHYKTLVYECVNNGAIRGKTVKHWLGITENFSETCTTKDNQGENDDKCAKFILVEKKEAFNNTEENESDVANIEALRNIDDHDDLININIKRNAATGNSKRSDFVEGEYENDLTEGEWKVCVGKKSKAYIRKKLKSTRAMTPNQVNAVRNVWDLSLDERWSLYMYWVQCYMKHLNTEIEHDQKCLFDTHAELQEIRNEENVFVLRKCDVVGMTTTGAAKYRDILKRLNPQIVIFEEAAEVLEAHVVTSLMKDTEHVILIGDHQQLRPNPTVYELAKRFHFDVSLYERMIKNGIEYHQLTIQHRMRPCIASLLTPHIYMDLINHKSVTQYENIKGINGNLYFVNHSYFESSENELKSHANEHEAMFVVELCKYLILQGYDTSQITVLTTYNGQLIKLKQMLKLKGVTGVRATVVDNFQGEENDIVIISFVRSNEDGSIGFLKVANRVCVALSRAKKGLYCIGNFKFLSETCNLWKKILCKLEVQNCIGESLSLCCQKHPENTVYASSWSDFEKVPDGGCLIPCEKLLTCGHVCSRKCHPVDLDHKEYKCLEQCQKIICENNHRCPGLCYEECKSCKVPVLKIVPKCGHEITVPCYDNGHQCILPCEKKCPCGHQCANICGYPCTKECEQMVFVNSPCGHPVSVKCYEKSDLSKVLKACKIRCNVTLKCGHICNGSCGKCFVFENGFLRENHVPCSAKCEKRLKCGHICNIICGKNCESCKFLIRKKYPCGHEKKVECYLSDKSDCYEKCIEILECGHVCSGNCYKCTYGAAHIQCKNQVKVVMNCGHEVYMNCSQNLPKCENSCIKVLPCGHKCLEKCSDPCNEKCEIVVIQRMLCGHFQSIKCFAAKDVPCEVCVNLNRKSFRFYEEEDINVFSDDDIFNLDSSTEDDAFLY